MMRIPQATEPGFALSPAPFAAVPGPARPVTAGRAAGTIVSAQVSRIASAGVIATAGPIARLLVVNANTGFRPLTWGGSALPNGEPVAGQSTA